MSSRPAYNQTFDASEMDLAANTQHGGHFAADDTNSETTTVVDSFSTSSSGDASSSSRPAAPPDTAKTTTTTSRRKLHRLPYDQAYDAWAATYDTDGNVLQAMDNLALHDTLLPLLLATLARSVRFADTAAYTEPLRITDLGCGTGRATLQLIQHLTSSSDPSVPLLLLRADGQAAREVHITGLDGSEGMLSVARGRVASSTTLSLGSSSTAIRTTFTKHPIPTTTTTPSAPTSPQPHALLSTLVLEHLPLAPYFAHVAAAFPAARALLLTNMHAGMPAAHPGTQAAFNPDAGSKVQAGLSVPHEVRDVKAAAREAGAWEGEVLERKAEAWMVEEGVLSARGRKWVGVEVWFGGVFVR